MQFSFFKIEKRIDKKISCLNYDFQQTWISLNYDNLLKSGSPNKKICQQFSIKKIIIFMHF